MLHTALSAGWILGFLLILQTLVPSSALAADGKNVGPLPQRIPLSDQHIQTTGRFVRTNDEEYRCDWSNSALAIRFRGTDLRITMSGSDKSHWQVVVDGKPARVLRLGKKATHIVAEGLIDGEHTVELVQRTEPLFGVTTIHDLSLNAGGKLLPPHPRKLKLEVIGDSISCGYGNESKQASDKFTPETENGYVTYGALAARELDAEYVCIAWSGKLMWPQNTLPELYDRALATDAGTRWDFAAWQPDVVVINLGTNDVWANKDKDPEEEGWVGAYGKFVARVRKNYPNAIIYCALGPMITDHSSPSKQALTTMRRYLQRVVQEQNDAGNAAVHFLEFATQQGEDGFGANWHPSAKTHVKMARTLVDRVRQDLPRESANVENVEIEMDHPDVRFIGRFDRSDPKQPRCSWSASAVIVRFRGTAMAVRLNDGPNGRYKIVIDGKASGVLKTQGDRRYVVADDLSDAEHTIMLFKMAEPCFGTTTFKGIELSPGATLLPPPRNERRIQVIGDSVTTGYGNTAKSEKERFSPDTQDAYQTYAAIAARAFDADYVCIAWSGRKIWPDDTIVELYDRTLPQDPASRWDFTRDAADVVVIALGGNDFRGGNPPQAEWSGAYAAFVRRIRADYPRATILCAVPATMTDHDDRKSRSTIRRYLHEMVAGFHATGDSGVRVVELPPRENGDGFGADWHPSLKTHARMGDALILAIKEATGWSEKR